MPTTLLSRDAYTVGWITILPVEFGAARAMFDEEHPCPPTPAGDPYRYAVGNINGHNVVITCSGEAGIAPANHCATQMKRTFTNIKIGLLSGIGGGVPTPKHDIRLGDVVVSKPGPGHSGVACYDAGKLVDNGFESTGHLDRPPPVLRNAVTWLETNLGLGDSQFYDYLANVKPADLVSIDGLSDELYEAGDITKQIRRQPRPGGSRPNIHHGLIASGSWVIKTSGSKRDDLLRRVRGEVLCFEMEAAGLMNTFPCLVVRGVSDYCDSHKNDGWHRYASTTAACYCKWLLKAIAVEGLEGKRSLKANFSENVNGDLPNSTEETPASQISERALQEQQNSWNDRGEHFSDPTMPISESELYECIQKMQYTPVEDELEHIKSRKGTVVNNSCSWISSEVEAFVTSSSPVIWIHGDPGKGKTMMSIYLIQHLRERYGSESVYFFFCQHDSDEHRTAGAVLKSLICQILLNPALDKQKKLLLGRHLSENFRIQGTRLLSSRTSEESLKRTLHNIIAEIDNAFIIVDGLDECEVNSVSSLIEHMLPMTLNQSIKYILTSRNQPKILHQSLRGFTEVHLEQAHYDALVRSGVKAFIRAKFNDLKIQKYQENSFHLAVKEPKSGLDLRSIETQMTKRADDSFIWAAMIHDQIRNEGIEYAMDLFEDCPVDLGALYKRIIRRVLMMDPHALPSSGRNVRLDALRVKFCRRILSTLCVAPRSMTKLEMYEAVDFTSSTANFSFEGILEDCGGLIVMRAQNIHFVHLSLKNYLLEEENINEIQISIEDTHIMLATSCMTFFEKIATTVIANRDTKIQPLSDTPCDGFADAGGAFMDYATTYLMTHATEALKFSRASVLMTKKLKNFFNCRGGCMYYSRLQTKIASQSGYGLKNYQHRLNERQIMILASHFGLHPLFDLENSKSTNDLAFMELLVAIAATEDHSQIVSTIVERLRLDSVHVEDGEQSKSSSHRLLKVAEITSLTHGSVDTWKYVWSKKKDKTHSLLSAIKDGHLDIVRASLNYNLPGTYGDIYLASSWLGPEDRGLHLLHARLPNSQIAHQNVHTIVRLDFVEPFIDLDDFFEYTCTDSAKYYAGRLTNSDIAFCQVSPSAPLSTSRGNQIPLRPMMGFWRQADDSSSVVNVQLANSRYLKRIAAFVGVPKSDLWLKEFMTSSELEGLDPINGDCFSWPKTYCRIFCNVGNLLDIALRQSRSETVRVLVESGFPVGSNLVEVISMSLEHGWGRILEGQIKKILESADPELVIGRSLHQALYSGQYECVDVILAMGGHGDMPLFQKSHGTERFRPNFDIIKDGEETTVMCRLAQENKYIALHYLLDKSPATRSMQYYNKAFIQSMTELKTKSLKSPHEPVGDYGSTAGSVRTCFYSLSERFGALPPGWQQHKTESGWAYFSHETDSGHYTTWQDPRIPYEVGESLDDFWSDQRAPRYDPNFEQYLDENYGLDSYSPTSSTDDISSDASKSDSP